MSKSIGGRFIKVVIVIALTVYFLALVVIKVPATLVTANLVKVVPFLKLAVVSGTAWQGQAADAVIDIQGQVVHLGGLKWRFKPASLLALKACVDLESEVVNGNFCRSISGANHLQGVQVDLPANLANSLISDANFGGAASLTIAKAVVSDKGIVTKLNGNLSWRAATISVQGSWFTLGNFAADLSAAGNGGINATIFDLEGPFGVKLEGTAGIGIAPSVRGEILPRENAAEDIKDVLTLIAVPQENGAFAVAFPLGS